MDEIVACPNCGKRNRVPATATGVPRCGVCHTALPWLTSAGDADFEQVAGGSRLPVLVDLWAPLDGGGAPSAPPPAPTWPKGEALSAAVCGRDSPRPAVS